MFASADAYERFTERRLVPLVPLGRNSRLSWAWSRTKLP